MKDDRALWTGHDLLFYFFCTVVLLDAGALAGLVGVLAYLFWQIIIKGN